MALLVLKPCGGRCSGRWDVFRKGERIGTVQAWGSRPSSRGYFTLHLAHGPSVATEIPMVRRTAARHLQRFMENVIDA